MKEGIALATAGLCVCLALGGAAFGAKAVSSNDSLATGTSRSIVTTAKADAAEVPDGWNEDKTRYYKNGQALKGAQKIAGKWYGFSSKGNRMKRLFVSHGQRLYCNEKGFLEARSESGTYMYANGNAMTSNDAADYKCVLAARKVVKSICTSSMTKAQKLKKCFDWVMRKNYGIHRDFPYTSNWPSIYAMDHFKNRNGDCHSDGAALCYLAYAIGYTKVYACTDSKSGGNIGGHGWAQINGRVYDPLFAQSKSYSKYYNCSYSSYYTSAPTTKVKIPYYSPKHANGSDSAATSGKKGLVKSGGAYYYYKNGKKLKRAWKGIKGKKYYFKANGKAAVGCVKVKKTYWVFNAKGQLSTGSKVHFITVKGVKYRVAKNGRAKNGWATVGGKKYRYSRKGVLMKGTWVTGGKLFVYNKTTGVYDSKTTSALRSLVNTMLGESAKAASEEVLTPTAVSQLKTLIGNPKSSSYMDSCNSVYRADAENHAMGGKDGIWQYAHVTFITFKANDGVEYLMSYEAK